MRTFDCRGQALMYDLMFAVMVFLLIFAFATSKYTENIKEAINSDIRKDMRMNAENRINAMAESSGVPNNWYVLAPEETEIVGLARKPLVISEERLNYFVGLDYNTAKEIMNVEGYEFWFEMPDANAGMDINAGFYPLNAGESIVLSRNVDYNSSITEMKFCLWREAS